jgi:WD40 repeat protein
MSTRERVDIDSCEDDDDYDSLNDNSCSSGEDSVSDYQDAKAAPPTPKGRRAPVPASYQFDVNVNANANLNAGQASTTSSQDTDDCNFTDVGWQSIRKQQDAEAEQRQLGILPPTPHQLQMAEEMAAERYANHSISHHEKNKIKVRAFVKKAQQSSRNVNMRHSKHSGSSDDGTEAVNKSKSRGLSSRSFGSDLSPDYTRQDGDSHSPLASPLHIKFNLAQEVIEKTRRAIEQQEQQMQWSAPPSNTVSVKCRHESSHSFGAVEMKGKVQKFIPKDKGSKDSYALPDDSIDNSFRPLLLIASKRKAHKGSIFVMKFSPHGGHFLATGGEDGKVCIWQVAPENKSNNNDRKVGRDASPSRSPERFVAGAKEREDAVEDKVAPLRTTADTLADESNDKRASKATFDVDIITHEGGSMPIGNDIKLLSDKPVATFKGHTAEVVDLAWSQQPPPFVPGKSKRNNKKKRHTHEPFLLSASLDKTVRLWHMSRPEAPLHLFQHADMVTCVDFHPTNDSYFVSGGFDSKLRLWSIANGRVKAYAQCPDIITSAKFTPDTFMVAAGLMKGQVFFYMTDSMKYYTQIDSKNRRGKKSEGCKVTGLTFHTVTTQQEMAKLQLLDSSHVDLQNDPASTILKTNLKTVSRDLLLVTTNDSRLRLYDLDGYGAIQKFKGLRNDKMQIKAHFCESGDFIICGSESGSVHVWENHSGASKTSSTTRTAKGAASAARAVAKLKATSHKGIGDRSSAYASFDGCPSKNRFFKEKEKQASARGIPKEIYSSDKDTSNTPSTSQHGGAVTEAIFAPSQSVKDALLACDLFRTTLNSSAMGRIPYDFSSAFVVAGDNEGTLRIFMKRSCLDTVLRASGPEGLLHGTP